jgi:hypothetical protein
MFEQNKYITEIYKKAWLELEKSTPLSGDCGVICAKKCCMGTSSDGMLLFPGEESLYNDSGSWYTIKDSGVTLPGNIKIKLFTCIGNCQRELRPLSCRIFPLMPYINSDGRIDLRFDLRGIGICPLISNPDLYPIDEGFIDNVHLAFSHLVYEKPVIKFLKFLSEQYDEIEALLRKFYSNA